MRACLDFQTRYLLTWIICLFSEKKFTEDEHRETRKLFLLEVNEYLTKTFFITACVLLFIIYIYICANDK